MRRVNSQNEDDWSFTLSIRPGNSENIFGHSRSCANNTIGTRSLILCFETPTTWRSYLFVRLKSADSEPCSDARIAPLETLPFNGDDNLLGFGDSMCEIGSTDPVAEWLDLCFLVWSSSTPVDTPALFLPLPALCEGVKVSEADSAPELSPEAPTIATSPNPVQDSGCAAVMPSHRPPLSVPRSHDQRGRLTPVTDK